MMKAAEIFAKSLGQGESLSGHEAQVLLVPESLTGKRAWLGTDGTGLPVAYFEIARGESTDFMVSQTISVQTVEVDEQNEANRILTVKVLCHEPKLQDVFFTFIDEVLAKAFQGQGAVEVIKSAARDWRTLLQVASSRLSESAAAGIYGEMRFLEEAVQRIGPQVLEAWQRSSNYVHDFVAGAARVEVKTSSFQNRSMVTIHGLRQLEPPVDASLTLAVAEVLKHGRETIDDVLDRIVSKRVDTEVLVQKLAEAGYVQGMPEASRMTFSLISWRFWEIDERSPVLNHSALSARTADGVADLSYSLQLSILGEGKEEFDWHRLESSADRDLS